MPCASDLACGCYSTCLTACFTLKLRPWGRDIEPRKNNVSKRLPSPRPIANRKRRIYAWANVENNSNDLCTLHDRAIHDAGSTKTGGAECGWPGIHAGLQPVPAWYPPLRFESRSTALPLPRTTMHERLRNRACAKSVRGWSACGKWSLACMAG
jgi:hypothetical protein